MEFLNVHFYDLCPGVPSIVKSLSVLNSIWKMYLSKSNKDIKYLSKRSGVAREVRTAPRDTLKRCDNIGV